jgi:RNA polymerase sigma-70 factor, ECF subfamily
VSIEANPRGSRTDRSESEDLVVLLVRVAARDEAAFTELYRRTSAKLYGVVYPILAKRDAGADAIQDAYMRIWEKAGDFDPAKGSPLAWMAAIARNRAIDEVRRVQAGSLEAMPEGVEAIADLINPFAARERLEELSALLDCLAKLDAEKRAVVMMAYYHGASRQALSKRFGRPVPTLKNWLRRSVEQLRDCLAPK